MGKHLVIGILSAAAIACGGTGRANTDQEQQQPTTAEDPCRVRSLEEICAYEVCPSSPAQVPRECGSLVPTERRATACGGTLMSVSGGFSGRNWAFDHDDQLVGVEIWLDLPHECADGTQSFSTVYGSVCEAEAAATDLCETTP